MTEHGQSRDHPGDEMVRLTVAEAADRLGITEAGVRKRVQRGQIPHERDDTGRVFVWVSPGETRHAESRDRDNQSRDELVEELRDQVRYLREQLDIRTDELPEERRIIAALTSRIPELEPPATEEPRESPGSTASPGPTVPLPTPAEALRRPQSARSRRRSQSAGGSGLGCSADEG